VEGSRRQATLRLAVALLIATATSVHIVPPAAAAPTAPTVTAASTRSACATSRADVLRLVNKQRAARHLRTLVGNSPLNSSAQVHSSRMARTRTLTHDRWVEEIRAAGYKGGWLGQNAAAGYSTSSAVMQAWMNSSGHRANILNGTYRQLGIGCVRDSRGTYWWTQNFGA
jgi:uncharacterized protein YkwD